MQFVILFLQNIIEIVLLLLLSLKFSESSNQSYYLFFTNQIRNLQNQQELELMVIILICNFSISLSFEILLINFGNV